MESTENQPDTITPYDHLRQLTAELSALRNEKATLFQRIKFLRDNWYFSADRDRQTLAGCLEAAKSVLETRQQQVEQELCKLIADDFADHVPNWLLTAMSKPLPDLRGSDADLPGG